MQRDRAFLFIDVALEDAMQLHEGMCGRTELDRVQPQPYHRDYRAARLVQRNGDVFITRDSAQARR